MPRKSRPLVDPEHPRHRLLRSAAEIFSLKGYEAATIDEIAEAAGLSKAAMYRYFPNKQALIIEIAKEGPRAFQALLDDMERRGLPPAEAIATAMEAQVNRLLSRRFISQVTLRRLPHDLPGMEEAYTLRLRYRHRLAAIIETGISQGVFAPVEPWLAVEAIVGMASSVLDRYSPEWPMEPGTIARAYAQLAVNSLLAPGIEYPVGGERASPDGQVALAD